MSKRDILGKFFYDFEDKYFNQIKTHQSFGLNSWNIIKYPLYWEIIFHDNQKEEKKIKNRVFARIILFIKQVVVWCKKPIDIFTLFLSLSFIAIRKFDSITQVLFYTNSVDKSIKNEQGEYLNTLTDGFILNGIVTSYLYVEKSNNGIFKYPSAVKTNFRSDKLAVLSSVFRFFCPQRKDIKKNIFYIHTILKEHFSNEAIDVNLCKLSMQKIIENFYGEYRASLFFLRIVKPKLIIMSEQLGGGFLAAANKLSIKTIDIQHGIIDKYHPQYFFSPKFKQLKSKLIFPNYVGLFGSMHKDILLNNPIWKKEEMIILGNYKLERIQNKCLYHSSNITKSDFVLIPTQRTVAFKEMIKLLTQLIKKGNLDFRILLKLHPLELSSNSDSFKELAASAPNLIQIANEDSNIYELILMSRIIVGFDSATLLDALSLGKPCITLTTKAAPKGIHEFFLTNELEPIIKPINSSDINELLSIIHQVMNDDIFYKAWVDNVKKYSEKLNASNYYTNCKKFIQSCTLLTS